MQTFAGVPRGGALNDIGVVEEHNFYHCYVKMNILFQAMNYDDISWQNSLDIWIEQWSLWSAVQMGVAAVAIFYIYRRLQGNPNSIGLQCEAAYWPALAVGGAAQLATAHFPNEQTLDPTVAARQTHIMPQPATLWPSPRNVLRQRVTIFSSEYYQILTATHLPTLEGWK